MKKNVSILLAACVVLVVISLALLSITAANLKSQIDGLRDEMNALGDRIDAHEGGEVDPDLEELGDIEADLDVEPLASSEAIDPATVLAEVNGEKWTYKQIYDDIMADSAELEGIYDLEDQATINDLVLQELNGRIEELVHAKMLEDLSVVLNEQAIEDEAAAQYEEALVYYTEEIMADGTGEAEAKEQAAEMLTMYGMDTETIKESVRAEKIQVSIADQVAASLLAERTTDEALREAYEKAAEEAKARYEAEPGTLEFELYYFGAPVYYIPEGYKTVKHIYLAFDDAAAEKAAGLLAELRDPATEAARRTEIDAQLEELKAARKDTLNEIQAAIDAGEDFDSLIEKYGEDGGMQDENVLKTGYYVNKESGFWDDDFVDAVEKLKPGEVSAPTVSSAGVHVIKCMEALSAGAVPFETVQEEIRAEVVQATRDEAYQNAFAEWSDKLGIKRYDDVLMAADSDVAEDDEE